MADRNERTDPGNEGRAGDGCGPVVVIRDPRDSDRTGYLGVLEQAGYHVRVVPYEEAAAAAGDDALLIILVFTQPATAGLALVRELRLQSASRRTPLIVVTPCDEAYLRDQIIRSGATAIFIEPVKGASLLRQLRRLRARMLLGAAVAGVTKVARPTVP
jgi:DNA-binding response OmpR family regulator